MEVIVNSQPHSVAEQTTLGDLIVQLGLDIKRIAVEYNRTILASDRFDTITLKSDDTIEIVNFVGGG